MGGLGSAGVQNKGSATVTVGASSGSIEAGQTITLEAYVVPVLATGTVTFYNGSTALGTATIDSSGSFSSGIAQLSTRFSSIGTQTITAQYSGNAFYSANTSAAIAISVSNVLVASSLSLQSSTTTPQYQTSVTLTATVSPSVATGTVTFYNNQTNIGSAAVSAGVATLTTSFAAGGTATVSAIYSGNSNYLTSTSNSITLNVSGPLATTTNLRSSTLSTAIGDSVPLTATLTPATATGTVTFYNGSTLIGSANVNAAVATLSTTFASAGKNVLKAILAGNASWEASTSNSFSLFVTGDTPDTVVLQVVPSLLVIGYPATLWVTVSPPRRQAR